MDSRHFGPGAWFVVLVSIAVGFLSVIAPSSDTSFSVEQAVDHVENIAAEPHPLGTEQIARVRKYLVETLTEMGLEPDTQTVSAPDYFGTPGATVEVSNVIARVLGEDSQTAVLLIAHYDTVQETPGANDNSAPVAALLETGRALVVDPPPHDVILLFTDGEEPSPRFGMSAFTMHPWFQDVALAVNFEGIGTSGPSYLIDVNGPSRALVDGLVESVEHPVVFSFLTKMSELIGGAVSDFDVIRASEIAGYNFAYMRGSSIYHTELDVPANLNLDGMAHQADTAYAIARGLGSSLDDEGSSGERVFFTIPGWVVVHYGSGVAFSIGVVAVAAIGWILWKGFPGRKTSIRGLAGGVGFAVLALLAITAALSLVWMGIVAIRSGMMLTESYLWLAALAGGVVGSWFLVWRRLQMPRVDIDGGVALVWALLCLSASLLLPAMSYLFVWPAIGAALAVAGQRVTDSPFGRLLALSVVTVLTSIVLVPAVDLLFQLSTPRPGNPGSELAFLIAVPILLISLAVGLVHLSIEPQPRP